MSLVLAIYENLEQALGFLGGSRDFNRFFSARVLVMMFRLCKSLSLISGSKPVLFGVGRDVIDRRRRSSFYPTSQAACLRCGLVSEADGETIKIHIRLQLYFLMLSALSKLHLSMLRGPWMQHECCGHVLGVPRGSLTLSLPTEGGQTWKTHEISRLEPGGWNSGVQKNAV